MGINFDIKILKFLIQMNSLILMKIYIIWLFAIILWNYGVPDASPLEDVIVAIVLSLLTMALKKYTKL